MVALTEIDIILMEVSEYMEITALMIKRICTV